MTDRLVIEITGEIPDGLSNKEKFKLLMEAASQAESVADQLGADHKIKLAATARSVRPGKGKATAPAVTPPVMQWQSSGTNSVSQDRLEASVNQARQSAPLKAAE